MEWEAEEEQDDEQEDDEQEDDEQEDDEERYVDKSENPAIAMKLKLMSEMNHNFIADKRLWQWIDKALRPADGETLTLK
ncbi:hypothetical protein SEPCBS119000_006731 [Sporothrix epigloea]|uniref:Uncharacterized protein n=1 Tax=Sporothrix epigloea TaxID=1892477 RepID=A0ABP0E538_9PEZI